MSELATQEREIDRLRELASIGAGHAAAALARLTRRTVWMSVPVARDLHSDSVLDAPKALAEEHGSGVFFELEGGIEGALAVIFSSRMLRSLFEILGQDGDAASDRKAADSAVREVANILVSHHASAIADLLGARVLPSIPWLATAECPTVLASLMAERSHDAPALVIESEIFDVAGDLRSFVLFFPSSEAAAPAL